MPLYLYRQHQQGRNIVNVAESVPPDVLPTDADYPRVVVCGREADAAEYVTTWARDWAEKVGQTVEARIRGKVIARYPER